MIQPDGGNPGGVGDRDPVDLVIHLSFLSDHIVIARGLDHRHGDAGRLPASPIAGRSHHDQPLNRAVPMLLAGIRLIHAFVLHPQICAFTTLGMTDQNQLA